MIPTPEPHSAEWLSLRRTKMRSHGYRSLGVGTFTAWAVTVDRLISDSPMSVSRWLAAFAMAAVAWFLVGGGSGVLWWYLPRVHAHDRDGAS